MHAGDLRLGRGNGRFGQRTFELLGFGLPVTLRARIDEAARELSGPDGPRKVRLSPTTTFGILYNKIAPLHMSQGDSVE